MLTDATALGIAALAARLALLICGLLLYSTLNILRKALHVMMEGAR